MDGRDTQVHLPAVQIIRTQQAMESLEDVLGRPVFIDDALGEEQHAGAHFAGEGPGTAAPDQRVQRRTDEPGYQEIEVCTCLR